MVEFYVFVNFIGTRNTICLSAGTERDEVALDHKISRYLCEKLGDQDWMKG
jgi:hypothetical protein